MLSSRFGIKGYAEALSIKIWANMIDVLDDRKTDVEMERAQNRLMDLLKSEVVERECEKTGVQSPRRIPRKKNKRVGAVQHNV